MDTRFSVHVTEHIHSVQYLSGYGTYEIRRFYGYMKKIEISELSGVSHSNFPVLQVNSSLQFTMLEYPTFECFFTCGPGNEDLL